MLLSCDVQELLFGPWGWTNIIMVAYYLFIPFVLTITSTLAMSFVYYRNERNSTVRSTGNTVISNRKDDCNWKMVKMTSLMVAGYVIICLPLISTIIITVIGPSLRHDSDAIWSNERAEGYARIVFNLNTIVDVIIYSFVDEEFQNHVKCLYRKIRCDVRNMDIADDSSAAVGHVTSL